MIEAGDTFWHGQVNDKLLGPPLSLNGGQVVSENGQISELVSGGAGRWMYCKYCYKTVRPIRLLENVFGETAMVVCSECGAGLTPPVPV